MRGTIKSIIFLMILGWSPDGWGRICGQQITDASGKVLLPALYDHVSVENDAEFVVWDGVEETDCSCDSPAFLGGKAGLYSVSGELLLPVIYDGIFPLADGVYKVNQGGECNEQFCRSGLWALYFTKKKHLTAFAYSGVEKFEKHPHFMLVSGCDFHGDGPRTSCRYGLMAPDGATIPPVYEDLDPTLDGRYLSVKQGGLGAFLDLKGRRVPLPGNDRYEYLGEDRFAAHRKEKAALFTEQGRQLTGFLLSQIRPFRSGTAAVRIGASCSPQGCSGGKWQLIDRFARSVAGPFMTIIESPGSQFVLIQEKEYFTVRNRLGKRLDGKTYRQLEFVDARWCGGGACSIKGETDQGKTILIDKDGNRIYHGVESVVSPMEGLHRFTKKGLDGLISPSGTILMPAIYHAISQQSTGYLALQNADGWGFADPAGKIQLSPQCERLDFQKQFVVCEKPEQVWLYNYQGKIINPLPYSKQIKFFGDAFIFCRNQECTRIREDGTPAFTLTAEIQGCDASMKACVFQGPEKSGAVDFQGQEIFSGFFTQVSIGEGYFEVYIGGKCSDEFGCMDGIEKRISIQGKELFELPPQKMPENDRFFQKKVCTETCEEHWMLLDKNTRELVRRKYDFVDNFVDGFARVSRDATPHRIFGYYSPRGGRWGIIDVQGREVLPLKYAMVSDLEEGHFRVNEGGFCKGTSGCEEGIYKIFDRSGRVVTVLKDSRADFAIRGGALLVSTGERAGVEKLIDLRGRVLHAFQDRVKFEENNYFPFEHLPWIFVDWSAASEVKDRTPWISVSGRPVGTPTSEFQKLGEGNNYLLWDRILGEPTQHTIYTREGRELLQVACGEFRTTGTHFACEAFRGTQRTGFLRLFDRQGKAVCALPLFHRGSAALPSCGPEVGVRKAAAGETAFHLVGVVKGHFIVRDAAGRFAALTPDGKWASGFASSWRIPAGEPGVFYTDPTAAGGAWDPEKPRVGLSDATGRALTVGGYEDIGPFSGGLATVRLPGKTPDDEATDGLINAQGKVLLDDPQAAVVHLGGGTALLETWKDPPGTESRVWTARVIDAQGRELVRFADAEVERNGVNTKAHGKVFVIAFHGDCRVFPGRRICRKKTYGLIDARGKILLKNEYAALELLGDGLLAAKKAAGCRKPNCSDVPYSIVDLEGRPVSALTYESVSPLESGGRVFTARRCVKPIK